MAESTPYNAAEPKRVAIRESAAKFRGRQITAGWKTMAASAEGRAALWALWTECKVFSTSFSTDHGQMAFNEGERNVALRILAQVEAAAPGTYLAAQRESVAVVAKENQQVEDMERMNG